MSLLSDERHNFKHLDRVIYEWDQTLTEVNVYIQVPTGVTAKQLSVEIAPTSLKVGLKSNPPYVQGALGGAVKCSESLWTLGGGELHIQLAKTHRGEAWTAVLQGHNLQNSEQESDRKLLLLERFQEEYSGFDFSGADIVGNTPDPRTFLRDLDTE